MQEDTLSNEKKPRLELVYNLTIKDTHEYFANNVLVHNCIASLLSIFFLTQAKNHELYGIDKEKILAGVKLSMTEENGGPVEEYRKAKQKQIKDTIDVYLERIKRCEDPYITQQLIAKTKALYNTLDKDFIVSFNLQDMLDKINSENRLKRIDISGSKKYAF